MESHWHTISWERAVEQLDSDVEKGLTEEESWLRQKRLGVNVLPSEKPLSKLKIILDQLRSPLIYILIAAALVTLFLREWADFTVISGAVLLNTIVGFFQENKATQALKALKQIVKIEAQVIRGGNEVKADSSELVPGDIVILSAGNKVPADVRLIEVNGLKVNEAPLTGEWVSAQKTIEIISREVPVADRDNMAYMGCIVEEGKAKAVVVSIGENTEIGQIALLVKETQEDKTPLQKKLAKFSRFVGLLVGIVAIFIFIGGIIRENDLSEMFTTSIAVAVAAVPEGLPVATTVILALGMQRILKRKGLVRKLVAAETLGSTSIIATDKTLTLTKGKMEVVETLTSTTRISGEGRNEWRDAFRHDFSHDQGLLVKILALCNEAFVENPDDPYLLWRVNGRPTDKALLVAGAEVGLKKADLNKAYLKINEIPFNSENKYIAALFESNPLFGKSDSLAKTKISLIRDPIIASSSSKVLFVLGAPEKILSLSESVYQAGKVEKMDEEKRASLNDSLEDLASHGLRVVSAAFREIKNDKVNDLKEEVAGLTFVGFIGLKDPLREETKEAIHLCKVAGLRPIIVTGDHLLTAKSIGQELGLKTGDENMLLGSQLDKMTDKEFQNRFRDIEIYARVEPRHKLKIVEAWQNQGHVVAMTGDGVNDAPALKKADIGVALGSGTDVAKEVSDLILLTDNFNIMVAAIEEGRAIIDNIRKVITYLLSDSFTETILISASLLLGWPLPLTAVQILWVNLFQDGLPALALAFEPKEDDVLKRKPEGRETHLFTREMKVIIFVVGILTDFILLGLLWWLLGGNHEIQYIRTMMFAGLGVNSLLYIFSCKSLRKNIWRVNMLSNKPLLLSLVFGFLTLFLAIYAPLFQGLLKTVPLTSIQDWLIIFSLGFINILLIEMAKHYFIIRHQTEA